MKVRVRSKIWLELEGLALLGDGKERLLRLVDQHGSISAAAREMGITYRKAWSMLDTLEKGLTTPLLQRSKGGRSGGGCQLTSAARQLLINYDLLNKDVQRYVDHRFEEIFDHD